MRASRDSSGWCGSLDRMNHLIERFLCAMATSWQCCRLVHRGHSVGFVGEPKPELPPGLQVRAWAAANGINEAANGTLNSYSLSMMALYHMQTVEGSATPALDALLGHNGELPAAINAETCGIAAVTAACSKHVERMPADEEQASLAELFLGFLLHYDALMSVWDCGLPLRVCPRTATMRCEPFEKSNPLAVEDPFDTNSNTASAVRAGGGAFRVRRAFLEGASFADETKRWTSTSRAAADAHVARLFESGPARSSSTADKSTILKPRRKSRSARRPVQVCVLHNELAAFCSALLLSCGSRGRCCLPACMLKCLALQSSNTNPQPSVGRRRRRV